jgi:hypothetical protein
MKVKRRVEDAESTEDARFIPLNQLRGCVRGGIGFRNTTKKFVFCFFIFLSFIFYFWIWKRVMACSAD